MKRSISGMEAVQAGILARLDGYEVPILALEEVPNQDAFRLWRSLPGYRKACRMLRRSGRRIGEAKTVGREIGVSGVYAEIALDLRRALSRGALG